MLAGDHKERELGAWHLGLDEPRGRFGVSAPEEACLLKRHKAVTPLVIEAFIEADIRKIAIKGPRRLNAAEGAIVHNKVGTGVHVIATVHRPRVVRTHERVNARAHGVSTPKRSLVRFA